MAGTKYTVITCFDGQADAVDAFAEVIARKAAGRGKIIPFPKSVKNTLEDERESSYNGAQDRSCASGLCG